VYTDIPFVSGETNPIIIGAAEENGDLGDFYLSSLGTIFLENLVYASLICF
jgi:hypothetical protein